jgi:uncharacterized membrane protein YcaP (DUF421 family)
MGEAAVPLELVRMFFGEEEPLFLVEIVVRTLTVLVYTLVLLRWIGHRAIGQLSLVEFLLVIGLGSAVGDAMFYPDTPLAHALLVITVVVVFDKVMDWLAARSSTFSDYLTGKPIALVENGIVDEDALCNANMAVSELHEELRLSGVTNLGEVARAYLETNGHLSVVRKAKGDTTAGLAIVPPIEISEGATARHPPSSD